MRRSLCLAVPATVAILSAALLCSTSGTALSQPTPNSSLPAVSVEAPKQVARPTTTAPSQGATTTTSRRRAGTSIAHAPSFDANSPLGRLARLERSASSCNGGCETSYRVGNQPWIGCSYGGEGFGTGNFSSTCTDTLAHRTYLQCLETRTFTGSTGREARWLCSSLQAAGRLPGERQVADIKQSGRR